MLHFTVNDIDELNFIPERLINAGRTGRDQKAAQKQVDELRKNGMPVPAKTPFFFPKGADRIVQDGPVNALDEDCAEEVEFVILSAEDGLYVTVGCDILDCRVDSMGSDKAKYLYPNYLAKAAWKYDDIKEHWDSIVMRSWLGRGRERLYQEGALSEIMKPEDMISELEAHLENGFSAGTVLSGGTLGCLIEGKPFADYFEFELDDTVLNRKISGGYEKRLPVWFIK